MSDTVEQVKSRLDIVEVLSPYVKLQRAGANWKTRCPFHNEKTPSFHISPERQSWHCFGCNKGGDLIAFVQEIEGIDFLEALRMLAAKAGVQMSERHDHATSGERDSRRRLLATAELTAKFFEKQLWHGIAGAKALAYLRGRGMTDETIRAWRLGWAPNDWQALTGFLRGDGHTDPDIVGAGVAVRKDNGRVYDRFRSRIMFPICDANGQVVGFTGRVFGAEVAVDGEPLAKYVNTPQTAIYDKSRVLYGLDKAKIEMRKRDACLLVEGNVDAVLSWQAGAQHVVATSGTALTPQQLTLLGRYSKNLDFCFDTDQAGQVATRRGIGLALAQDFIVRILTVPDPECKDPADYVAKHGVKWNDAVAATKPALQYYYDTAVSGYDSSSPASKRSVVNALGPLIKRLASRVEKSHWIGQLALLLRVDQAAVEADVAAVKDDIATDRVDGDIAATHSQLAALTELPDMASLELLSLITKLPELTAEATEIAQLVDPRVAAVIRDPQLLTSTDPIMTRIIDVAHLRADDLWGDAPPERLRREYAVLIGRLRERDLRTQRAKIELEIRAAEAAKDHPKLETLLAAFQEHTTELNRLQHIQSSEKTS